MKSFYNIAYLADTTQQAQALATSLSKHYGFKAIDSDLTGVDILIIIGGDGFMLHSLHQYMNCNIPLYGMNSGSLGFLMNSNNEDNLIERISNAKCDIVYPLEMVATNIDGEVFKALAINEVSLLRQTNQTAKLRILINQHERMPELTCDGVLVSTPAGSSAYNLSAGGAVLPLDANLLALTTISPFRPRGWKGALLPNTCQIKFEIIDAKKRPVSAVADFFEVRNVSTVIVSENRSQEFKLLFDSDHHLAERLMREQFAC